ncbi:MAG: DNA polymerase III subunit epsilon [Neisseriaceae bacterium]|nr:DNA polymerase III subunit epsilon [Neisseriaceae bacterium]
MSIRQLILDTETTGLSAKSGDRLVEFAALEMIDRRITGSNLHIYINPKRDIPEEVVKVHGLDNEFLADKPTFAQIGHKIADFIKGAELIIHNAPFDVSFLNMEFTRMGLPEIADLAFEVTDTLVMAKQRFPGQKNSLDALCNRLKIDRSKRVLHGALIDCELLAEVYLAMTREQYGLGIDSQTEKTADSQIHTIEHHFTRPQNLKIVPANDEELAQHNAYLDIMTKQNGGQCLFRASE